MLKIRLRRPGKSIKGRRHQKIVVTERAWARESKFVDEIGYYDPGRELLKIDTEKYKEWVSKGAQPSETVASLFKNYGKPKKVKKKNQKKEESAQTAELKEAGSVSEGKDKAAPKEEVKEAVDASEVKEKPDPEKNSQEKNNTEE